MWLNLLRHQDTPAAVTPYSAVILFLCGDLIATVLSLVVLCALFARGVRLGLELTSGEMIPQKRFGGRLNCADIHD